MRLQIESWGQADGRYRNDRKEHKAVLQKPEDYDRAESYGSDAERLPAGGYVCEIKKAEEKIVGKTGTMVVTVGFDIAEGEYRDFYSRLYRRQKMHERNGGKPVRWLGTYSVSPYTNEGLTNPAFKGLLECVEKSNEGFRINWPLNLDEFRGLKVGLLFREEEYEGNDRKLRTSVRACWARTVDCIRKEEYIMPARRKLEKAVSVKTGPDVQEFIPEDADDEELPF